MKNEANSRTYYVYEVVDIETGYVYPKEEFKKNKNLITVSHEERTEHKEHRGTKYRITTKRRLVRHNGQQSLFS